MKKIIVLSIICILFSCKKDVQDITHTVQFQSNIKTSGTYELTISGVLQSIDDTYQLKNNSSISLSLIRSDSTKWLTGTIYVDGKATVYDAGYKDFILTLTIK